MIKYLSLFVGLVCGWWTAEAVEPVWWTESDTQVISSTAASNNYGTVNLGQLKHVAKQAKKHLDLILPGGAGTEINTLVATFQSDPSTNYSPVNLGQLKAVAKPFYDRLVAAGVNPKSNLISRGYPQNWPFNYPWDPATPVTENYAPANLGQLKMVFSFECVPVPTGLYLMWRFNGGASLAWDSNGAFIGGMYTVQRKLSSQTNWEDIASVQATSVSYTDATLPGAATAKYRIIYFYGSAVSAPSNELDVAAYDPLGGPSDNGGGGSSGSSGGTPPVGQDGPQDDPDEDGLTNEEEIEIGSDRTKADSDDDGKLDGEDGWPMAKFLNPPRLPMRRYAVIELVQDNQATPVALNNHGDVIYEASGSFYYRAAGQPNSVLIENLQPGNDEGGWLAGIADDGTVVGGWPKVNPSDGKTRTNFRWDPSLAATGIVYTGDSVSPQFNANSAKNITSGGTLALMGITAGGSTYGFGQTDASRYDPPISLFVSGFAVNGQFLGGYARPAVVAGNEWLVTESGASGSATWNSTGHLINNVGECLYYAERLIRSGGAPSAPDPTPGYYYYKNGMANRVNFEGGIAMNDDLHILNGASISARVTERASQSPRWSAYNAPRISRAKPYGPVNWTDFTNRLEAIGFRNITQNGTTLTDHCVLINDHDYSIQDLMPEDWAVVALIQINESGTILAQVRKNGEEQPFIALLLPVEINSMDRFLAGSIDQAIIDGYGGDSNFGLVFRHKTTAEAYSFNPLSEAYVYDDPYNSDPEGEDKFLSNSEIALGYNGQLGDPQLSQDVVFYRHDGKLHFRALFDTDGEIEIGIMVGGNEIAKIEWELHGDLDVGHLAETVDTILSGTWGSPPPQGLMLTAMGGVQAAPMSVIPPTSFPGYFAARGLTIKVLMPAWDKLKTNFVDGLRKAGAVVARGVQMAVFGGKGFCEGAWMGVKDDATSLVELGKMILNPAETAKTFYEGFKVLMKLDLNGWKNVGKTLIKSFLETGQNGVDDWGEPNNLDVAAYLVGYTSGFVTEQIAVTYITAGILKAGNVGAKIGTFIRNAAKNIFQPLADAVEVVRKQAMMMKNSIFRRFSQDVLNEDDVRKLKILLEQLQVDCCPAN